MAEKEPSAAKSSTATLEHPNLEKKQELVDILLDAMPDDIKEQYLIGAHVVAQAENITYDAHIATQKAEEEAAYQKHLKEMATVEKKEKGPAPRKHRGLHATDVHKQHHTHYDNRFKDKIHEQALIENATIDAEKVKDFEAEKERLQELEAKISGDPRFRRLMMMAMNMAEQRNKALTGDEDAEKEVAIAEAKEDKFTELFDWYENAGMDNEALEYILDHAFVPPTEKEKVPAVKTKIEVTEESEKPVEIPVQVKTVAPEPIPTEPVIEPTPLPVAPEDLKVKIDDLQDIPEPGTKPEELLEADNEPITRSERLKSWLGDRKQAIRDIFTDDYWKPRWDDEDDLVMNADITEQMTHEEVQHKKERKRTLFMLGMAGLLVLGGTGAVVAHTIEESSYSAPAPTGNIFTGETAAPLAVEAPAPAPVVMPDYFNIPRGGETGVELFANIGLDQNTWKQYQNTLVDQFHDDFFRLPSGNVGIMHSGSLSEPAKQFINKIPR